MNANADYSRVLPSAPADRAVTLHATIAAAGRVYRNAMPDTQEYRQAECVIDMAEAEYAATVPRTTHRGAMFKLFCVARGVAELASGEAGDPAANALSALLSALRKLAHGDLDAMPALRRAAVLCRAACEASRRSVTLRRRAAAAALRYGSGGPVAATVCSDPQRVRYPIRRRQPPSRWLPAPFAER